MLWVKSLKKACDKMSIVRWFKRGGSKEQLQEETVNKHSRKEASTNDDFETSDNLDLEESEIKMVEQQMASITSDNISLGISGKCYVQLWEKTFPWVYYDPSR